MDDYPMLTTIDNPYSPFTQFDDWFAFDAQKGYHSLSLLARVANISSDLSEEAEKEIIQQAIDEIVYFNLSGVHTYAFPNE